MSFFRRDKERVNKPETAVNTNNQQPVLEVEEQSEVLNTNEQPVLDDCHVAETNSSPVIEEEQESFGYSADRQFVTETSEEETEGAERVEQPESTNAFLCDPVAENTSDRAGDASQNVTIDIAMLVKQLGENIQSDLYDNLESLISKSNATLIRRMDAQKETVAHLHSVIEQQEQTIRQQHNALLQFQEDVFYKLQKGLILELIDISDNLRMMLQDNEQQADYDLLGAVKGLNKWLDATLENNSIHRFQDTEEDATVFNRKRQEILDREDTDDRSKDNTYVSVQPGYVWSIPYLVINSDVQLQKILSENKAPQQFAFVIRPEQVVKLKYNSNENLAE